MDLSKLSDKISQSNPKPMGFKHFYSVFLPLVLHDGEWSLLYEVRSPTLRRQPNEICFPGGGIDEGESAITSALRELREELGVEDAEVLGELDFLCHRSGVVIYPVVGTFSADTELIFSVDEVAEVFYVPISELLSQNEICTLSFEVTPNFTPDLVGVSEDYVWEIADEKSPIYRYQGRIIWGMTARITNCFLDLLLGCGEILDPFRGA
ncbi:MAG: CoA pyrophosphatase [Eubacteriales bacterium]